MVAWLLTGVNLTEYFGSSVFTNSLAHHWVLERLVAILVALAATKSHLLDSVQHSISSSRLIAEPWTYLWVTARVLWPAHCEIAGADQPFLASSVKQVWRSV